jgi:hypothetical protein
MQESKRTIADVQRMLQEKAAEIRAERHASAQGETEHLLTRHFKGTQWIYTASGNEPRYNRYEAIMRAIEDELYSRGITTDELEANCLRAVRALTLFDGGTK